MKRASAAALAAISLLALPSIGQAAQRYAAPGGSGTACVAAAPCPIAEAIGKAQADDEVILGTGTYTVTEPLFAPAEGVNIHGDFGAPMPTIKAAFAGPIVSVMQKGRLSYVEVDNVGDLSGGVFCSSGNGVERVVARVSGSQSVALSTVSTCVVRDSLLLAAGAKSTALYGGAFEDGLTGVVRNVTAIASGAETIGVRATYGPALKGSYTLDVRNTIADGTAADAFASEGTEGVGNITISSSNFDRPKQDIGAKITDAGGNQAGPPLFVNAAGGDYREAPGSPTIDAGVNDQLGALDLLGSARILGAGPDIGAYEYAPARPEIVSLSVAPAKFHPAKAERTLSCFQKYRSPRPRCADVHYELTASASVAFTLERLLPGRRVGGKCRKQTAANRSRRACVRPRAVRGGIDLEGSAGANAFTFSGWFGGRRLKSGRYRLTAVAGGSSRTAQFKIAAAPKPKRR